MNNIIPDEVKKAISLSEYDKEKKKKLEKIWLQKDIDLLKEASIEYDYSKICNFLEDEKDFIQKTDMIFFEKKSYSSVELKNIVIEWLRDIFYVHRVIKANNYLENRTAEIIELENNVNAIYENGKYKTYALCHHVYEKINSAPETVLIHGTCFRKELYYDECRRMNFNMVELVSFDSQEALELLKVKLIYVFFCIAKAFYNTNCRVTVAMDSFISDNKEYLLYQMLKKTKIELQIFSSKMNRYISIGSINIHGNHYTNKYKIRTEYGKLSSSLCMGIGIERLNFVLNENESG